jgi:hypothetical protein
MSWPQVNRWVGAALLGAAVFNLHGCSSLLPSSSKLANPINQVSQITQINQITKTPVSWQPEDQLKWESVKIPGKLATEYSLVRVNNRNKLMANAQASASMLRQDLHIEPERFSALSFSWQIQKLIADADMAQREHEDSPVRLVLAFDGDRSQFSPKNAMLSELSHALSGKPMPYATLMYVWCNHRPVNTVIHNPRTDRIRKMVIESGPQRVNQLISYERNIRADYEKAFGEPPGALIGIAIMTDTDNTRSHAQSWYGPISLLP